MADIIQELQERLAKAQKEKFVILLMGQTGRGKSSTVNSLLGREVAPVNDFEPETMSVITYDGELNGVKFQIIDTPGLCDDLEIKGNDDKYIELIKARVKEIDCLWFVTRLDDTRVSNDERRAVLLVTEALGEKVWNHALCVFTFAGNVAAEKFDFTLKRRGDLLRKEIELCSSIDISKEVPAVAVDNKNKYLPNKLEWLGELYTQTFRRMKQSGSEAFIIATAHRIKTDKNVPTTSYSGGSDFTKEQFELTEKQEISIRDHMLTAGFFGFSVGAKIGMFAGPAVAMSMGATGAAIGAAAGAVVGFFRKLFS